MEWLAWDYITIKAAMPKPVSAGPIIRHTSGRSFGHPAEWASDTLRDIADKLNTIEDDLREHLHHDPAVHPGHAENRRVALALDYLTNWFDELCVFPGAPDAAIELNDLHHGIRSTMGYGSKFVHMPVPCPSCDLLTLFRVLTVGNDQIDCRNCGEVIGAEHYGLWTRILVDEALDTTAAAA
ncbi:MAG: hypothetical protein ACREQ5_00595 [Candidatus Dormibacteria bacterium]